MSHGVNTPITNDCSGSLTPANEREHMKCTPEATTPSAASLNGSDNASGPATLHTLASLEAEQSRVKEEFAGALKKVSAMMSQKEVTLKRLEVLKTEVAQLEQESSALEVRRHNAEVEFSKNSQAAATAEAQVGSIRARLEGLQREERLLAEAQRKLETADATAAHMVAEAKALEAEVERLAAIKREREESKLLFEESIGCLESEMNELHSKIEGKRSEAKQLTEELEEKIVVIDNLREKSAKLEQDKILLENQQETALKLEEQLAAIAIRRQQLGETLKTHTEENKLLEQRLIEANPAELREALAAAERDFENMRRTLEALQAANAEARASQEDVEKSRAEAVSSSVELRRSLNELELRRKDLAQQKEQILAELANCQTEVDNAQQLLGDKKAELTGVKERVALLEVEREALAEKDVSKQLLEQQKEELSTQIAETQAQIAQLSSKLNKLASEKTTTEIDLQESITELASLRSQADIANKELDVLRQSLKSDLQETEKAQNQREGVTSTLQQTTAALATVTEELQLAKTQFAAVTEQLGVLTEEISKSSATVESMQKRKTELENLRGKLQPQKIELEAEIDTLTSTVAELQATAKALRKQSIQLKEECKALQKSADALSAEKELHQTAIAEAAQVEQKLQVAVAAKDKAIVELQTLELELTRANEKCESITAAIDKAEARKASLQSEKTVAQASLEKLTEELRKIQARNTTTLKKVNAAQVTDVIDISSVQKSQTPAQDALPLTKRKATTGSIKVKSGIDTENIEQRRIRRELTCVKVITVCFTLLIFAFALCEGSLAPIGVSRALAILLPLFGFLFYGAGILF